MPQGFVPIFFSFVEKISKFASDAVFTKALNQRMETSNLTIAEIGHVAARKGMNISEVTAMPELDSYRYDGKPSLICSNLVAWIWKAGGLF